MSIMSSIGAPCAAFRARIATPGSHFGDSLYFMSGFCSGSCVTMFWLGVVMSARRVRVFIDFWNFQLSWNDASSGAKCDWRALPGAILGATADVLKTVQILDPLDLEETLLYASVDPERDGNLRNWLNNTVDRFPSWRVSVLERRPRPKQLHCRHCGETTSQCPRCQTAFVGKPEKGVDSTLVTDMLSLAWQGAFDIAVLVSSDADFVPAVERIQASGLKVINAAWASKGHHLKAACWGSFDLNESISSLVRPS